MSLIYLYAYMFLLLFIGLWPFNFWQTNQVSISKAHGIMFDPPGTAYTKVSPEKLSHLKEFTIFLDVTPDEEHTNDYNRILTYGLAGKNINFTAGQWEESFVFIVRLDGGDLLYIGQEQMLKRGRRTMFAVVCGKGKLTLYRDGTKVKDLNTGPLAFTVWDKKYPLVIGSDAEGTSCWAGNVNMVSIFNRTLSDEEIGHLPQGATESARILHYSFGRSVYPAVLDEGTGPPADLSIPQRFAPYQRRVLKSDWGMQGHHLMDILVNIVGFIPLGFLLAAYLSLRRASTRKIMLASAALGFGMSLTIELLQVFLPTRASSIKDVVINAVGSVLGALVLAAVYPGGSGKPELSTGTESSVTDLAGRSIRVNKSAAQVVMNMTNRHIAFLFLTLISVAMFYEPLRDLLRTYTETDSYLHIILIPLISGYLLYEKRWVLFSNPAYSWKSAISLMIIGLIMYFKATGYESVLSKNDYASFITSSAAIFWVGSFLLIYGVHEFRSMAFPLVFLVFMIPVPSPIMGAFVEFLQYGSTVLVDILFRLIGTPFLREGFVFHLPGVSVEIADECSGIHSSFALLIVTILASHLFIRVKWKKAVLIVFIIPIVLVKNSIRIVVLSLLGAYVDEKILTHSFLHQSGGFLFYIPALILIIATIWMLGKTEKGK